MIKTLVETLDDHYSILLMAGLLFGAALALLKFCARTLSAVELAQSVATSVEQYFQSENVPWFYHIVLQNHPGGMTFYVFLYLDRLAEEDTVSECEKHPQFTRLREVPDSKIVWRWGLSSKPISEPNTVSIADGDIDSITLPK